MTSIHHSKAGDRILFGLSLFALLWSFGVLQAGGFTTSINAGMAFLDWPLSNGSINPPGWLTESDKFAEHSHRLAATGLGILTILIAIAHRLRETRRGVRIAAYSTLALVVAQGGLGALRVLLDQLNVGGDSNIKALSFAIGHAINAQLTVALLACVTLTHTRLWQRAEEEPAPAQSRALGVTTLVLLLLVILAAAVMRQNRVTLWTTGEMTTLWGYFIPAVGEGWMWTINLLHRGGALLAGISMVLFANSLNGLQLHHYRRLPSPQWAAGVSIILAVTLSLQILLGVLAIDRPTNPHPRTIHLMVAAALLATTACATLLCFRGAKNSA